MVGIKRHGRGHAGHGEMLGVGLHHVLCRGDEERVDAVAGGVVQEVTSLPGDRGVCARGGDWGGEVGGQFGGEDCGGGGGEDVTGVEDGEEGGGETYSSSVRRTRRGLKGRVYLEFDFHCQAR
jgi:hypothetical protein